MFRKCSLLVAALLLAASVQTATAQTHAIVIPGAWYGEALPHGEYAAANPGVQAVVTHLGNIAFPPEEVAAGGLGPLYVRATITGSQGFRFSGQSHGINGVTWEWNNNAWANVGPSCGLSTTIYDLQGVLHLSPCGPVGTQGYRYVADDGTIVSGDDSHFSPAFNLFDYTVHGDIAVGQGPSGGVVAVFQGKRYIIEPGNCQFVRFNRDGDLLSISTTKLFEHTFVATWLKVSELSTFPEDVPPPTTVTPLPQFPRKLWFAPFYSFSERYGDTPLDQWTGNSAMIVEDAANPDAIRTTLTRVQQKFVPMFIDARKVPDPIMINQTIAWWIGEGNVDTLGNEVQRIERDFTEKPIIAYLDGDSWPATRPAWIDGRVWPSVQAYRFPNEPLAAFNQRVSVVLARVASYGVPIVLTPRFDDFNGTGSIAQTLEAMPLYDAWIRQYFVVAVMPFSDRRGHGIAQDTTLHAWAKAFLDANPTRPNRFDYWVPKSSDTVTILKNKLMQSTEIIILSAAEKQFLIDCFTHASEPAAFPNRLAVVQEERNKLGTLLTHADAGELLNRISLRLDSEGFGMLRKDGGNNCPVNGLAFRVSCDWLVHRPSGKGCDVFAAGPDTLDDGSTRPGPMTPSWCDGETFDVGRFLRGVAR